MDIKKELDEKREQITQLFEKDFIGKTGFPVYTIDSVSGEHLDKTSSLPELGDYLPFLLYFGEEDFSESQRKLVEEHFDKIGFIWNTHTRLPKHSWAFEYTDLILGLLLCYELSKKEEYLKTAEKVLNFVLKKFYKKGFICTHYFSSIRYTLPITSSICGIYPELLCDFYRLTKKQKYLDLAEKIMKNMINSEGFQKYGVFQTYYPINSFLRFFLRPVSLTKRYDSTKYNSHASFGLIALYEITKDKYYLKNYMKWVKGINTYMKYDSGGYSKISYIKGKNNFRKQGLELMNFHLLESFCDMYSFCKEESLLKEAEELADFWLDVQGKTGLLPFYLEPKALEMSNKVRHVYKKNCSFFDAETDFFVGLIKLWELNKKEKYKKAAEHILEGIFRYHKAPIGFFDGVDITSGEVLKKQIDTRFLSLFLKVNILHDKHLKSYDNRLIYSMLRDR